MAYNVGNSLRAQTTTCVRETVLNTRGNDLGHANKVRLSIVQCANKVRLSYAQIVITFGIG